MFAWSRTFYAKKNNVYYNFDMKRQRDNAVQNHGFVKVSALEAYKHYSSIIRVPWRTYGNFIQKESN